MELPIQVMIVLFVSILVGSSVILFSTDIMNEAKKTIFKGDDTPEQEFVIEINQLTEQGLKVLMTDCFNRHSQSAMSRTPCYVVHASDPIAQFAPFVDFETDITYSSGRNTLLIYYNPNGHKIEVQN